MELMEAARARHSVRSYLDKPIEREKIESLRALVNECNRESGLHIQLVTDEPKAFSSFLTHYGLFDNIRNYIVLVGPQADGTDELCGFFGEKIVLEAQRLGLNTCWAALTYRKIPGAFTVEKGEKLVCVIALGYGKTQGKQHRSKPLSAVMEGNDHPEWFVQGVECALLAPTAVNQQKFKFSREGNRVEALAGRGSCAKIDLGIVKYHFEIGAGKENFEWKQTRKAI